MTSVNYVNPNRIFAIAGSPGQSAFTFDVSTTLTRFYDYGSAPATESISGLLDYTLQTSPGAASILLDTSEAAFFRHARRLSRRHAGFRLLLQPGN